MARYKNYAINPTPQQNEFAKHLFNVIRNDNDTNTITVMPGRCGIGKTTAVQALISYFTQEDNYTSRSEPLGIIIITDALERLESIKNAQANNLESHWKGNYQKYEKHCAYIKNSESEGGVPVIYQLIEARIKPIIMLSTQRYFNMPEDQREMLFTFKYNENTYRRELVIIDEKPYFYSIKDINIKNLNDCNTALYNGIPSTDNNKEWVLNEFWRYREKLEMKLKEKEKCEGNVDRFYWKDSYTSDLTANDKKFFNIINQHKKTITNEYIYAIDDLKNFKKIQEVGAFFCTQKYIINQDYKTYLQLIKDNKDSFFLGQGKAKFIILDATADIDPDYKLDYVKIENCDKYNVPLNLLIHHMNVNTSRSQIVNNYTNNYTNSLVASIKEINKNYVGNFLVVTYKDIEERFLGNGYQVGHFGGLKGSNSYVEIPNMGHIGLNRYSDFAYFISYLAHNVNEFDKLKKMGEDESRAYIKEKLSLKNGLFINNEINDIMLNFIMADFEQNIFRTAIRKYGNDTPISIWAYWSCDVFNELNERLKNRYEKYGVQFFEEGTPHQIEKTKIENRKTVEKTAAQKFLDWHDKQEKGRTFKKKNLLEEIGITEEQFDSSKRRNKYIKDLMNQHKTDKQGVYMI